MRRLAILLAAAVALWGAPTRAHELWFHLDGGGTARLTFGDTPAPGEAERVAEIAHTKVWSGGKLIDVVRLPDGLEAKLPEPRPALLSAYADRGVVDYQGQTFVIQLAAYAQTQAVDPSQISGLGLGDDQVRLLLVSKEGGPPVVRATWKGKPAADVVVKVFHGAEAPLEIRTNSQGEVPSPDLMEGPWTLFTQVVDKTAGTRDGRSISETRYKATLAISPEAALGPAVAACLARVKETHGATGPWAVAGYRMGERALKELGLPRHDFNLLVVHHSPAEVQYTCIADGLQAATGTSPGKLNLRLEEASVDGLKTVVSDRRSNKSVTFTLKPEFIRSVVDLPHERLEAEGRRVASLPDEAIFATRAK
ncbi:formylmethanofuran dehydrogenase subunit E family protein [Paludisphaera mucosa]|uniref:Formylmethanofuran dehydrogenase subunit E family protein n=1 Tax=Paludisphaera mucosa TaxID=3030827 RepID=A0ABT6FLF2_9BACT|nr:formylmethanofuran dehydrogenase subunit E family protein [Paludisphaera mucosa]MDG3008321.1 formylmethanofuran dehydrogenase subunit E family protein [Paludisphaera mucosa]